MTEPLLTVLLFTYNHEASIAQCIERILDQTTDFPYEIQICEDCSTDNTAQICREYATKYPHKIKLFAQKENTFRNPPETNHVAQAFKRPATKYWCYIDGDDYWCDKNYIQEALEYLEKNSECYTFAYNTLLKNADKESPLINEKEAQEFCKKDTTIEERCSWTHPSGRIHRKFFGAKIVSGDALIAYQHLYFGTFHFENKIRSVYNYTDTGAWSSLPPKKKGLLNQMLPYRMYQVLDFKKEGVWLKMLRKTDRRLIKFFKLFLPKELAWKAWFFIRFVPTFGRKALDPNFTGLEK